ncbi:AAA family ATPase [Pantoea endophytica]|uniref:AAA family ATPase n=1 Tax=Pantoea endophytica TaxID=92488 RepID=UPI0030194A5A
MIYSYGFANYFGFKEGAEVSFELNSRVPKDVSFNREVATILGVKGANGAGKTNLLKGLGFLLDFCAYSFRRDVSEFIKADPYFDSQEPSDFYIDFKSGDYRYTYELGVSTKEVHYERLFRKSIKLVEGKSKGRKVCVFERKFNKIVKRLDEISEIDVISLRENASLISTAHNYNFSSSSRLLKDVFNFFSMHISNVIYTGMNDFAQDLDSIHKVSEFYNRVPEAFDFVKDMIKKSDLGISDIEIHENQNEKGEKYYYPLFRHEIANDYHFLTIFDQSSGTKSLYVKLQKYWYVLTLGGTLILDEFDLNCHPFMLPKLLELFESPESNKLNSQFIFTSHITEVLDKLTKFRTYIVNKENNESFCYRLDEIPGDLLRHGRPISPIYNEGKIGGVPKL